MKVTCTGRRVSLKPSFIEKAEAKLAKLDKFFPNEAQAQVTVNVEKSRQTVEITVRSTGLTLRAEKASERMEDAFNDAFDLLMRRVVKYRKRLGDKLTSAAAEIPAVPAEPEESYEVIREKHFAVKPCSTEEAILQMNLLGHSFFLYRSIENDCIQAVYRRADGGYGVLIPEN
ncbi:ribosome hibernation-promoting factor, HPF/YfiA family [uncultured Gemmiger sp.]|uniref:ribosome hibernation-promoting factor, HPF/YfiA family n=1 Tax=uncultured Gemmiger sp. TaxID=1623490 RepID=UPI0025DEDB68|nr:ribosome-associated translation inhibitor RaiA [uncultured Gemmiger sp.]